MTPSSELKLLKKKFDLLTKIVEVIIACMKEESFNTLTDEAQDVLDQFGKWRMSEWGINN